MNILCKQKEGMKRSAYLLGALLAVCLVVSGLRVRADAAAYSHIPVRWESVGGSTALSDDAYLIGGVTYVPFRAFSVLAGNCEVSWNARTRTATAKTAAGATVSAKEGNEYIEFGERIFYTVAPVRIVDNRLYVPIRAMSKCFGIDVGWDRATRSVYLKRTGVTPRHDAGIYDSDALYWLSRIISAESKSEPFRGQVAVGNVVLNRVKSGKYPNTIYQVIFDKRYGVQFTPTVNGTIYAEPTADAVRAAKICLEGYTLSESILYFFNPAIAQSHWISQNCTYAFRIGGHVFYT
ncbi:MAG: cell wall hydrolase [Clostridia bacterium]|nr:cell wall hydrolase [Clostridia bacterium]